MNFMSSVSVQLQMQFYNIQAERIHFRNSYYYSIAEDVPSSF